MVYQVLIPLELCRGVTANVLVPVAGDGGIEYVNREVQYAVLRVFIGQDNLVHRPLREGFVEVLGGGEMIGVKVTLANRKQVDGR